MSTAPTQSKVSSQRAATASRRRDLYTWISERDAHQNLTASEIVDVSGIYDRITHGRYDMCLSDLKAMERNCEVYRDSGRPARWTTVANPEQVRAERDVDPAGERRPAIPEHEADHARPQNQLRAMATVTVCRDCGLPFVVNTDHRNEDRVCRSADWARIQVPAYGVKPTGDGRWRWYVATHREGVTDSEGNARHLCYEAVEELIPADLLSPRPEALT
jgi:hypothetical protein